MLAGIVIIATNHPYYGRMAYNLAVTIKASENFPVTLLYQSPAINHLSTNQRGIFDELIEIPSEIPGGWGAKLYLDKLSPYHETLYLDADMLWLPYRKPSELFEELNPYEYTGITEGKTGDPNLAYYFWADESEIREKYKVESVYQWRSEVIYFKKETKLFNKARKINPTVALKSVKKFGTGIPDELYINIAAALLDIHPHRYKWTPAYWPRLFKDVIKPDLSGYYLISFGSNWASTNMKKYYMTVLKSAANKLGVLPMFELTSKRSFMPERQKM